MGIADRYPPLIARRGGPLVVSRRPSFDHPDSQMVTVEQIVSPCFASWGEIFGVHPGLNRKIWEYLYILHAMDEFAGLGPGTRALGFGVGRERIVPVLAKLGCEVLATDYGGESESWPSAAHSVADLVDPEACDEATFRSRVSFRSVDMNHIPQDLRDFDCLWSCGSLEHIGGLEHGLDFIENAMECLRPGGIAVHTTEYNLISDARTYDTPGLSLYRQRDLIALAQRLLARGHQIVLNFEEGDTVADRHIDREPGRHLAPSLKWELGGFVLTSFGLIVQKNLGGEPAIALRSADQRIEIDIGSLLLPPSYQHARDATAIAYDARRFSADAGDLIFYGPYTVLPRGNYRLVFEGEVDGEFKVRLTASSGGRLLHEQTINAAAEPISFSLSLPVGQFEVLMLKTPRSRRFDISRIVLTRTP